MTCRTRRTGAAHAARPDRSLRRLPALLGALLVLTGGGLLWSTRHYRTHSAATAAQLVRRLDQQIAADPPRPGDATPAGTDRAAPRCAAPPPSTPTPPGTARAVLAIPALRLTAPILAGTDDTALNSGVGHLDASHWPDQGGTGVLEAHDVTFFAHLPRLRPGQTVTVTAPCRSWTYTVRSGTVAAAGSPVPDSPRPTLVLITCYPSDALFLTNQRYVVTAELTSATLVPAAMPATPAPRQVRAALPPGLDPSALTADDLGIPLGRLHLTDPLDPNGYKSAGGLQASQAATQLLAATERAATEGRPDWWETIAPRLPYNQAQPLAGPARWAGRVDITVTATDGTPTGATLTGTLAATGQTLTLTTTVHNTLMTISSITAT